MVQRKKTEPIEVAVHCTFDEKIDPNKLKPHPANPATHPPEQIDLLAKIILAHGVRHPITVSKRSGFIVAGHARREAAIKLKMNLYPVDHQNFKDDAEELAVLVADNQIQELAETDGLKMADVLVELDRVDYPLELTALTVMQITNYVEGPTFEPVDESTQSRLDEKSQVKCPECGNEFVP